MVACSVSSVRVTESSKLTWLEPSDTKPSALNVTVEVVTVALAR